jgi:hypothetical protein
MRKKCAGVDPTTVVGVSHNDGFCDVAVVSVTVCRNYLPTEHILMITVAIGRARILQMNWVRWN